MTHDSLLKAALIIIDVQTGFDQLEHWGGRRNNLNAEDNIVRLLNEWRSKRRPVIHVKHNSTSVQSPLHPSSPGNELKIQPINDEPLFEKSVNSSFIGTNMEQYLRDHNIDTVILVGLTTNHCVSTTARMGANLGFNIWIVDDACATFDRIDFHGRSWPAEDIHNVSICNLKDEFAQVIVTNDIISMEI